MGLALTGAADELLVDRLVGAGPHPPLEELTEELVRMFLAVGGATGALTGSTDHR